MALPGVRTVLKDRFYSLSRADAPDLTRVVAIARRGVDPDPWDLETSYETGDTVTHDGLFYEAKANVVGDENNEDPATDTDNWKEVKNVGAGSRNDEDELTHGDFKPFNPRREEDVIVAFGRDSELHRAYLEATSGSASQLVLVPLPGDTTDENLLDEEVFDKAFGAAETAEPDIVVPWGRGRANEDDDDDGENLGFRADYENTIARVAEWCKRITDRTTPCFAVLGVTPLHEEADPTADTWNDHFDFDALPDREDITDPYVVVVATELAPVSRKAEYHEKYGYGNGATTYAALLSTLASEKAGTGKLLYGVDTLRFSPTRAQQETLIDKGVTPVALNFNRAPTVVDAMTFSPSTSDYTRLTTLRIAFDATTLVRRIATRYIGMPATLHHRNALDTAITSGLRNMMIQGALVNADHQITYMPRENKAQIDLILMPAFELRTIEISVSVQL